MARELDILRGVQPLVRGFGVKCVTFELLRDLLKLPQVGLRAKRRFIHKSRTQESGEQIRDWEETAYWRDMYRCVTSVSECE